MGKLKKYVPTPFMDADSHYDEKLADYAVNFIGCLCHTKGRWAGKRFELLDWQEQIVRDIFGIVKPNGYRQFNTAYVEIPKKQGKSELAAAVALLLTCEGEPGAEVYSCASDRQQASIVFNVAADMVQMSPALSKRIKVLASQKRLVYYPTNSYYQVLSSEAFTKHGLNVSGLVPEFIYYIRCAEFISVLMEKGCVFCEANPEAEGETSMVAKGFYNLKLSMNMEDVSEIVSNDLTFNQKNTVYILTGANRGGKTTITQAVGQLFVLAQGGLFVPAESFHYVPCDSVYTHFPADEDKTMDLGRLGEECVRFKEMFSQSTSRSLMLLNETFSTTSFEEGYYIARDSIKALQTKAVRTIYNTHMHKLGEDAEELTRESSGAGAASLIMRTEEGKRSFKVALAKPEGSSYAKDIAEKYGVTYDMLLRDVK